MFILFFNHSGISYLLVLSANLQHFKELDRRAESGTRTRDLLITNELLYQLSYFGSLLLKSDANLQLILNLQKEI